MDIKSEVLKYIDLAEDTAKASLQLHLTDMSDQNYNESLELIKELRETVSGVWDNSTVAAMKKAVEVEDCILRWLKSASAMICSTEYVRELRSAVDKAGEWSALNNVAEDKRFFFGLRKNNDTAGATEEDIEKNVAYNEKIKIVAVAKRLVLGVTFAPKSLDAMERLLQSEEDNFNKVYNMDELEAQIDENNARLKQMREQFKVMVTEIRNGEVTPDSSEFKMVQFLVAEYEQEEERARFEREIITLMKTSLDAGGRIKKIENTLHNLRMFREHPLVFGEIVEKAGVARLRQFIAGEMSPEERDVFIDELHTACLLMTVRTMVKILPIPDINENTEQTEEFLKTEYVDENIEQQGDGHRDKPDKNSDGE